MTEELVLYHAPRTRSVRVRWLLEEMRVPYTLEPVAFDRRPAGDENYALIHPLRKIPALRHGSMTMIESTAMVQYILARFGPSSLAPDSESDDYGPFLQWIHFSEASMSMPVNLLLAHTAILPEAHRNPGLAHWAEQETLKLLEFIGEHGLKGEEYLVGNTFSAADICIGYMFLLLKLTRKFDMAPPAVKAYFERLSSRDAWIVASS